MLRRSFFALSTLLLGGCGSVTGLLNREIQENEITVGDPARTGGALQASVLGMSENRRGILIRDNRRLADGTPSLYFCAEPPPDVAMSTRAGLAAGASLAGRGEGRFSDEYTRVAMALSNRTSLLDIYRTSVFSLCQMHMNGAISHEAAESLFRDITLEVIKRAPSSDAGHVATAGVLPAPMATLLLSPSSPVTEPPKQPAPPATENKPTPETTLPTKPVPPAKVPQETVPAAVPGD
jgi:hypothetical protein